MPAADQVGFLGKGDARIDVNLEVLPRALEGVVRIAVTFTDEGTKIEVALPTVAFG